jgi:hypothetical protein
MADEHGTLEPKGIDHREHIVGQPIGIVAALRHARTAMAAPGNAVNVTEGGQARREVVEDVSGVAKAREEYERPPGATPVEDFERHLTIDSHHRPAM